MDNTESSNLESLGMPPTSSGAVQRQLEVHGLRASGVARPPPDVIGSHSQSVSVNICPPSAARPYYTLFTTSALECPASGANAACVESTELMLCLPLDWPLTEPELLSDINYWPVRLLYELAVLQRRRSLRCGETASNGEPAERFARSTALCGVLFAQPRTLPREAWEFRAGPIGVRVLAVVPIYESELRLAQSNGGKALQDRLDAFSINEVVSPERAPAVPRRVFGS